MHIENEKKNIQRFKRKGKRRELKLSIEKAQKTTDNMNGLIIKSILARFMFQEKAFYHDENTEVLKSPHTYKILPDLL